MNGRSSASQLRKERIVLCTGFSSAAKKVGEAKEEEGSTNTDTATA